jgi:hypothetical protein
LPYIVRHETALSALPPSAEKEHQRQSVVKIKGLSCTAKIKRLYRWFWMSNLQGYHHTGWPIETPSGKWYIIQNILLSFENIYLSKALDSI